MNVELIPFSTPNYVIGNMPPRPRQEGFNPDAVPKWHLSQLDECTLSKLCDDFRAAVFAKARKKDPKK